MATSVLESLNTGLLLAMAGDENILIIGEDILDPYGGAFKITRGASTRFPERVLSTPISEGAIVGMAAGLAMRGFRPIVEIMFGDFITLAVDQLVNHAAKFRWMYNNQVRVPMVVRTPMGGRRGYGPTHSQSLEKLFLGIPGLKVVAPNTLHSPASTLMASIQDEEPVLFIENKVLYPKPLLEPGKGELKDFTIQSSPSPHPVFILNSGAHPQITMACYGFNFELARQVAIRLLYEFEIYTDIVLFTELSPFKLDPLLVSLRASKRLLTIEEGTMSLGWGSEVAAQAAEAGIMGLAIKRAAALALPIANAKTLEDLILPSPEAIVNLALSMLT